MRTETSTPMHGVDTRVVYDRETGEILHIHQAAALGGRRLPSEAELRAAAIDVASKITGISGQQMDVIQVRDEDLIPHTTHVVDIQSRRLVTPPRQ